MYACMHVLHMRFYALAICYDICIPYNLLELNSTFVRAHNHAATIEPRFDLDVYWVPFTMYRYDAAIVRLRLLDSAASSAL